jgi:hypothetical protein
MADSPMTEAQGDKVIRLLEDILWELQNIKSDGLSNNERNAPPKYLDPGRLPK